jgi:hypothetical protein
MSLPIIFPAQESATTLGVSVSRTYHDDMIYAGNNEGAAGARDVEMGEEGKRSRESEEEEARYHNLVHLLFIFSRQSQSSLFLS